MVAWSIIILEVDVLKDDLSQSSSMAQYQNLKQSVEKFAL